MIGLAGYLAAAGIYALDHHIDRLADDHRRARRLAEALDLSARVARVLPVDTNIVLFEPADDLGVKPCLEALEQRGVLAAPMGENGVRLVTHLGLGDTDIDATCAAIEALP